MAHFETIIKSINLSDEQGTAAFSLRTSEFRNGHTETAELTQPIYYYVGFCTKAGDLNKEQGYARFPELKEFEFLNGRQDNGQVMHHRANQVYFFTEYLKGSAKDYDKFFKKALDMSDDEFIELCANGNLPAIMDFTDKARASLVDKRRAKLVKETSDIDKIKAPRYPADLVRVALGYRNESRQRLSGRTRAKVELNEAIKKYVEEETSKYASTLSEYQSLPLLIEEARRILADEAVTGKENHVKNKFSTLFRKFEEHEDIMRVNDDYLRRSNPLETDLIDLGGEVMIVSKHYDYGYLPMIDVGSSEFYIAKNDTQAGEQARAYYADMADNDKEEFACLVGESNLIAWALGKSAGPGSVKVNSLSAWLDLFLKNPEETFASYDGTSQDVKISASLYSKLFDEEPEENWADVVAFRHN